MMNKKNRSRGNSVFPQQVGSENALFRKDFQEAETIPEKNVLKKAMGHKTRMSIYRDRVMLLTSGIIDSSLFDKLDRYSNDWLENMPKNSEIALYSDFIQYLDYCRKLGVSPLPFQDNNIDVYLSYLMTLRRKRSTIDRHLASLVKWATILEIDDPRRSHKVKIKIATIRENTKGPKRQVEGMRVDHLKNTLEVFKPDVPRDCQDITLLFIGFETLCRESELVSFNWEDFELQSDGSSLLNLSHSKTDQEGDGAYLFISRDTTELLIRKRH